MTAEEKVWDATCVIAVARAIDTLKMVNARTDSGPKAAWTIQDLEHTLSSFASEDHTEGKCPVCRETVFANDIGCISIHRDTSGRTCVGCGEPFHLAVTA